MKYQGYMKYFILQHKETKKVYAFSGFAMNIPKEFDVVGLIAGQDLIRDKIPLLKDYEEKEINNIIKNATKPIKKRI